jgi:hypothetical protein
MSNEVVDIEDEAGNLVGQLDLSTMRALAPHPELDKVVKAGGDFYYRKNGMRLHLRVDPPPKKSRRAR